MPPGLRRLEQAFFPIMPPVGAGAVTFIQQRPVKNWAGSSLAANFYKEWGADFADNDTYGVAVGKIVEWRLGDGVTVVPSQADNYVYWPSGRLRRASFTGKLPNGYAAGATDTLKAYSKSGTWNNSSWTSNSAITSRDIRAEVTIGGITYTLSANNEVTRGTSIQQKRSGPQSAMWKIWGEWRNGTSGSSTAHGTIWPILYLTFFSDGTYSAWLTFHPSRCNINTAAQYTVTDYKVKDYVGGAVLFDYSTSFTAFAGTPLFACDTDGVHPYTGANADKFVIGFGPMISADSTTTSLYDGKATHWYASTPSIIALISTGTAATYSPNSTGDYGDPDQTGGNPWVGPMTRAAVNAMLVGDWASLREDRVDAFASATNGYVYDDVVTGYPANLTNATTYSGLMAPNSARAWWDSRWWTIVNSGGQVANATNSASHMPLYAWFQYLATGQEWWLDMLHDQVIGLLGAMNPDNAVYSRNPLINSIQYFAISTAYLQARAGAWGCRSQDNTHWVTPDNHVMKPYLGDIVSNWFNYIDANVLPPDQPAACDTLGIFNSQEGDPAGGACHAWMHDYMMTSFGMAIRRGRITGATGFVPYHIVKWVLGRGINGCMWEAFNYLIGIKQGTNANGAICTAWNQAWTGLAAPFPWLLTAPDGNASCPPSGIDPNGTSLGGLNGAGSWGPGHTYPNVFMCGAAAVADEGIPTADTAYAYMQVEEGASGVTAADWAPKMHWNIRRRA